MITIGEEFAENLPDAQTSLRSSVKQHSQSYFSNFHKIHMEVTLCFTISPIVLLSIVFLIRI